MWRLQLFSIHSNLVLSKGYSYHNTTYYTHIIALIQLSLTRLADLRVQICIHMMAAQVPTEGRYTVICLLIELRREHRDKRSVYHTCIY